MIDRSEAARLLKLADASDEFKAKLAAAPSQVCEAGFKIVEGPCRKCDARPNERCGRAGATPVAALHNAAPELAALLRAALAELDALRGFAQEVMEAWPEGGFDGGDIQDIAEKHGLLKTEQLTDFCAPEDFDGNSACGCRGYYSSGDFPIECYRKTPLLTGAALSTQTGGKPS